jgi:single-stranded-DNA-specific exonuclease
MMLQNRWTLLTAEEEKIKQLQESLKIHPALCKLLVQRGVDTYDDAKKFFRPSLQDLHDPFLMNDMQVAVDLIGTKMAANEHIMVYGDYDVDGTTSVALVYGFLKNFYANISFYIPCRYKEGYGVSMKGIETAAALNAKLIIALDCGITAIEQVDRANELGIDFIICDHHKPADILPKAKAILNPKRKDNTYPFDELSGCGIGFKLAQAFTIQNQTDEEWLAKQLDLVALSIASDLVPVTGENRTLAYFGLQRINQSPRMGVKTIMELTGIKGEVTINTLVFVVGPRINAAGRIEHGNDAVKLLIADTAEEGFLAANILHQLNTERKDFDKSITAEALKMLDDNPLQANRKTTVLVNNGWHKGVIGIVASRLMANYYRPTIILAQSDEVMTGSVRSVKEFDVYEALKKCSDLLIKFGGHKYAAGVSLEAANFDAFCERFESVVADSILPEQLIPEVVIDAEIELEDATPTFFKIVEQFGPFGPGNMTPHFVTKNLIDSGRTRLLNDKHLKLDVHKNNKINRGGIGFDMKNLFELVKSVPTFDAVYSLMENEWKGTTTIEWRIVDIKQSA